MERRNLSQHTVVTEGCTPQTSDAEVSARVVDMLGQLSRVRDRLRMARRVFIKLNVGEMEAQTYRGRPVDYVDPAVFRGLATFVRQATDAHVLVGDGPCSLAPAEAARAHGHMAIIEEAGFEFVDLNAPPFSRFLVPRPAMFRWYELSSALCDADFRISVTKMKSHHLAGVTLTIKNLFGLPPDSVYGKPRAALHSSMRLPRVLADLLEVFPPEICVVDGIVGSNYCEWCVQGGDPVTSGVLIVGDNAVATDATAARCMGLDPQADRGTAPFLRADNHIKLAAERGLGSSASAELHLMGQMPTTEKSYSVRGANDPNLVAEVERQRRAVCRNAQWYFDDRERFVKDYQGEIVWLAEGQVVQHVAPIEVLGTPANKAVHDGCFAKLVQAEEAELRKPYLL